VATSKVDICNSALIKVGAARISSLDDNTKEGRLCKELYPRLCDELVRSHPWNFATARVALAATVATPAYGFDYQHQLPNDCLRVMNINLDYGDETGKFVEWKIEGRMLLANDTPVKIKYLKDVSETPELFDAHFAEALALRIAVDLAYPMAQSTTLVELLSRRYQRMLADARTFDGQEGSSDRVGADTWLDARF
jgi:hypothetical protein